MDTNQDQTKPGTEVAAENNTADAQAQPITITVTPEMLAALGITGEVTPETVMAAFSAQAAKAGERDAQIAMLTAERDAAFGTLKDIETAKTMAEVDTLLAEYDLPETALPAMRDLATADREKAKSLLSAVPKKKQAATPDEKKAGSESGAPSVPPPKPIHDPGAAQQSELTPEQKSAEAEKLIKAVQKEGKFKDYTAAREQARRRNPALFA